jgi:hypothetical protein
MLFFYAAPTVNAVYYAAPAVNAVFCAATAVNAVSYAVLAAYAVTAISYVTPGVTDVSNGGFYGARVLSTACSAIKSVSSTSTVLLQNKRCSAAELSVIPNAFQLLFLLSVWFFSTCTVLVP